MYMMNNELQTTKHTLSGLQAYTNFHSACSDRNFCLCAGQFSILQIRMIRLAAIAKVYLHLSMYTVSNACAASPVSSRS